jgi:hypothetical protein
VVARRHRHVCRESTCGPVCIRGTKGAPGGLISCFLCMKGSKWDAGRGHKGPRQQGGGAQIARTHNLLQGHICNKYRVLVMKGRLHHVGAAQAAQRHMDMWKAQ